MENTAKSAEVHIISRVCQCCLDDSGNLKTMLQEYTCNGIQEVYRDMLHECLSILIPMPPSGASDMLICDFCIEKLRKIMIFRQQIQDSQRLLRNLEQPSTSNLEGLSTSANSLVKKECSSDDEVKDVSYDSDDTSLETYRKNNFPLVKQNDSEDVLQNALERTKKNLQLLRNTLPGEDLDLLINSKPSHTLNTSEIEPENKQERKRYLGRKNYAKNIPFKLEKTDRICKVCNATFPSNKGLVLHMPTHYPNHICNECGRLFVLKIHLDRHVAHTHDTTKVACPTCSKLIKKTSLPRHIRVHTGNTYMHKCNYCPEKFKSHGSRVTHMLNKHDHKTYETKCPICSKIFTASSLLTTHMKRVHYGERKHKCTQCDKCFFSKNSLQLHMVKHTQEKKYECEVCHKKYGRKFTLTEHLKTHNNVKNHICSICDKAFTQKCSLQAHVRIHDK